MAPNVPLPFIAQKTEGFSGADLAELCQRAAKAAVRDAIAADELRAGDDDAMDTTMGNETRLNDGELVTSEHGLLDMPS